MNDNAPTTLHVRWDDGAVAASPDHAPVLIGRSDDAAAYIGDRSVSRSHLRVHADNGAWVAVDESSRGTFDAAGTRIDRVQVAAEETVLHLGDPAGPTVRLSAVTPPAPEPPPVASEPVDGGNAGAGDHPPAPAPTPYVPPIEAGDAWTVATSDPTLRLEVDGTKHAFFPPDRITVGRDSGCNVVCDNDLVSRQHLAFTSSEPNGAWTMEDLGSSRGTFVDGQKLTAPTTAEGAFVAVLGDEDAGSRVQVVTAGVHRKPADRSKWIPALAVLVLGALISVGAVFLLRPDSDEGANTAEQLAAAKESTVYVFWLVETDEGVRTANGSGTFVSDDLILTNAHVANIAGELLADPFIGTLAEEDEPVLPSMVAREVARHPYLDLALLQVDDAATEQLRASLEAEGTAVGPTPTPIPLGDSRDISVGSEIDLLGFSALAGETRNNDVGEIELPVTAVSEGQLVALNPWPGCASGQPVLEPGQCSPDGDLPRGNFVTDEFSSQGGSGGPWIVDGRLVAVLYGGIDSVTARDELGISTSQGVSFSMPIEYFRDWLDEEIANNS